MPDAIKGRILYFGRNASMMALVGQQLSAVGMRAEGFMDEQVLRTELAKGDARMLVIGGGVEETPREQLKTLCHSLDVFVLEHFGGPGKLTESISEVLG